MPWIGLHKFADVIIGISQKLLYIPLSNLVRSYITNKGIFLSLQPEEQMVTSSRPLLFLIILSINRDWVRKKK